MTLQKFQIQIADNTLEELSSRLSNTRWPNQLKDSDWERGMKKDYLQSLVHYWQNNYDWRTQEKELNSFSQFKCDIDGINIHFIWEKGKGKNPMPIILTHGWPDSFLRYKKIINRLTDPVRFGGNPNDSFDVIVPSLPGFGFSDKPNHSGYNNARTAELWVKLMTEKLGYIKFAAGGGDIGSGVTRYMALNHPKLLTGIYLTDIGIIRDLLMTADESKLSAAETAYRKTAQQWMSQEAGYISIQSTKPQTLSYGLSDSPIGTAAWILEKFRSWSDCKGQLENSFSKDELLTNVMIYWLTNTLSSSADMYYENTHSLPPMGRITVPTGLALFSQDILLPPKEWAEKNLNIVQWTEIPNGGHFTAMEEPELFVEDISKFYRKFRV